MIQSHKFQLAVGLLLVVVLLPLATTARWTSVDPKASKYPSMSPYVYVANNPLIYIDPSCEVLEKIWDDPKGRNRHNNVAVPYGDFVKHAQGKSLSDLQGPPAKGYLASSGTGPNGKIRYVVDPSNSQQVIDMRHFLVIGQNGETFGLLVELLQLTGDNTSAFDSQDFLSNTLGTEFFENYYDPNGSISEQLKQYFEDRAAQANQNEDQSQNQDQTDDDETQDDN